MGTAGHAFANAIGILRTVREQGGGEGASADPLAGASRPMKEIGVRWRPGRQRAQQQRPRMRMTLDPRKRAHRPSLAAAVQRTR